MVDKYLCREPNKPRQWARHCGGVSIGIPFAFRMANVLEKTAQRRMFFVQAVLRGLKDAPPRHTCSPRIRKVWTWLDRLYDQWLPCRYKRTCDVRRLCPICHAFTYVGPTAWAVWHALNLGEIGSSPGLDLWVMHSLDQIQPHGLSDLLHRRKKEAARRFKKPVGISVDGVCHSVRGTPRTILARTTTLILVPKTSVPKLSVEAGENLRFHKLTPSGKVSRKYRRTLRLRLAKTLKFPRRFTWPVKSDQGMNRMICLAEMAEVPRRLTSGLFRPSSAGIAPCPSLYGRYWSVEQLESFKLSKRNRIRATLRDARARGELITLPDAQQDAMIEQRVQKLKDQIHAGKQLGDVRPEPIG